MTETREYSAMLYALADEIRREEGCVTTSAERVEEAAERLDLQTVRISVMAAQRADLLTALGVAKEVIAQDRKIYFATNKTLTTGKIDDPRDQAVVDNYDNALAIIAGALKRCN